jgi:hypothetical protein
MRGLAKSGVVVSGHVDDRSEMQATASIAAENDPVVLAVYHSIATNLLL